MIQRTLIWGAACLLMLAEPLTAYAQAGRNVGDADAGRSHFNSGVEYYRDGDLKAALIEFKRAYAVYQNFKILYNLGQVSSELLDYVEAQRYLTKYLSDGGNEIEPGRKLEVEAALAKLSGRIAKVVVSCNVAGAEVFLDDVSIGRTPLRDPLHVNVGSRRISATMNGRARATQTVEAAGGETLYVQLDLLPSAPEASGAVARDERDASPNSSGPSPVVWLGIGTGALAVGAAVMGTLAAIDGGKYRDAVHRKTTAKELDSLHSHAATKALVTDILLGATVLTAAITIVVAVSGHSNEDAAPAPRETARAWLTLGPGSIGVAGQL